MRSDHHGRSAGAAAAAWHSGGLAVATWDGEATAGLAALVTEPDGTFDGALEPQAETMSASVTANAAGRFNTGRTT